MLDDDREPREEKHQHQKLCRYALHCKHFRDSSYTCWHEEEAKTYCGTFRYITLGGREDEQ